MKSGFLTFLVVFSIFLFGFGMMKYGSIRIDLRAEETRFAAAKELGFINDEETRLRKSMEDTWRQEYFGAPQLFLKDLRN